MIKGGGGVRVMSFLGVFRHMNFRLALALALPLNENPIELVGFFLVKWAGKKAKMHLVIL